MDDTEEIIVEIRVKGTLAQAEALHDVLSQNVNRALFQTAYGLEVLDTAVYKASLANKVEEEVENAG